MLGARSGVAGRESGAIAMTLSYRRYMTGVMTAAALVVGAPMAVAQQPAPQSRIRAGIEEAVKAMDNVPKLKKLSPQERRQLVEFVVGNTLFVMGHELGHVLISEMDMPVLGREEDAADSFAIVTALNLGTVASERVLIEAGKGWVLSSMRDKKQKTALAFYDEHGLDLQRSYNVVCMMVGSDPKKYEQLAKDTKLPEERQTSCVRDYKTTAWSWEEMLKPRLRAANDPKQTITVEYQDPEDKKYAVQQKILRDMGLLDILAAHAADRYKWPKPFSRECGDPNAFWNAGTRTLTLCYELAGEFIELYQGYSKKLPKKYGGAAVTKREKARGN
jgi:hypothetical protein